MALAKACGASCGTLWPIPLKIRWALAGRHLPPGFVMSDAVEMVTAPLRANARPVNCVADVSVIELNARTFP
jgi:hypothetical protein